MKSGPADPVPSGSGNGFSSNCANVYETSYFMIEGFIPICQCRKCQSFPPTFDFVPKSPVLRGHRKSDTRHRKPRGHKEWVDRKLLTQCQHQAYNKKDIMSKRGRGTASPPAVHGPQKGAGGRRRRPGQPGAAGFFCVCMDAAAVPTWQRDGGGPWRPPGSRPVSQLARTALRRLPGPEKERV